MNPSKQEIKSLLQSKSSSIRVEQARKLGYLEVGDPDGIPVFHFHSYAGSRVQAILSAREAEDLHIRLIGVDRPGHGISDFHKGAQFLDWPEDISHLADHLGIHKFSVLGFSGGCPFSLACAFKIPERVDHCVVISPACPVQLYNECNMPSPFVHHRFLRFYIWKNYIRKSRTIERAKRNIRASADLRPEPDRVFVLDEKYVLPLAFDDHEGSRQGYRGIAHEYRLFRQPWGFDLSEISLNVPVHLWVGGVDSIIPSPVYNLMSKRVPLCISQYSPDEGHMSLYFNHVRDILALALKRV